MSAQVAKLRPIGTIFKTERDISGSVTTNLSYKTVITTWEVMAHPFCEEYSRQYYGEEVRCVGIEYA